MFVASRSNFCPNMKLFGSFLGKWHHFLSLVFCIGFPIHSLPSSNKKAKAASLSMEMVQNPTKIGLTDPDGPQTDQIVSIKVQKCIFCFPKTAWKNTNQSGNGCHLKLRTDIHTYSGHLIGPSPPGGPKLNSVESRSLGFEVFTDSLRILRDSWGYPVGFLQTCVGLLTREANLDSSAPKQWNKMAFYRPVSTSILFLEVPERKSYRTTVTPKHWYGIEFWKSSEFICIIGGKKVLVNKVCKIWRS